MLRLTASLLLLLVFPFVVLLTLVVLAVHSFPAHAPLLVTPLGHVMYTMGKQSGKKGCICKKKNTQKHDERHRQEHAEQGDQLSQGHLT